MESPLWTVPRPLSLDSSVSPCPLLDLSITTEPRPPAAELRPLTQPIAVQRRTSSSCRHSNSSAIGRVTPQSVTETSNQLPECPEGVELNTTLVLRAELQSVQRAQWDAAKAVKETLDKHERTQSLINTRATQGVSFPSRARLYSGLVSVHVPEGHVIKEAVQRLPLAAALKAPPPPTTSPSLLPLTFELYHRPLPLMPSQAQCLKPRPHSAPFSLFQRQQRWASGP